MLRPSHLSILIAASALLLVSCGDDAAKESAASRARDSSLAADLKLAAADTGSMRDAADIAMADRLGNIPPMVEGEGKSDQSGVRVIPSDPTYTPKTTPETAPETPKNTPTPMRRNPNVASSASRSTVTESPGALEASPTRPTARPSATASRTTVSETSGPSGEDYTGASCASPALSDQRRCLLGYLARSDVRLDANYQALITRLKREAGTRPGAPEPPPVQRLRTAQRAWLVYRDDECRRRNQGQEGPLWAPTRAKCLGEYSDVRSRELSQALAKRGPLPAARRGR